MKVAEEERKMTFDTLLKRMPLCLAGSLDVVGQHRTASDLAWLAQHEIDLFDEGEESDIRNSRERDSAVRFMELCRSANRATPVAHNQIKAKGGRSSDNQPARYS
jgi:hypothetical protein